MAAHAGPDAVENGLVLYLDAGNTKSYPGSGTAWTDLSGNGNHATLVNGPTYNSSNNGLISFDGVNDYATMMQSSSFNFGSGNFTVDVWVKPTAFPGTGNTVCMLSQYAWYINSNSSWYFRINQANKFLFIATKDNTINAYLAQNLWLTESVSLISLNTWHNVVFSRNGSTATMYINGLADVTTTETSANFTINTSTRNMVIGYFPESNDASGKYFSGFLGPIRIYKGISLSATQIQQNFNAIRGRYNI